jgi:hypothetical protein
MTGNFHLILRHDFLFVDLSAAVRTVLGQRGFVELFDLIGGRRRAMRLSPVADASFTTTLSGSFLGFAFREGSRLPLALSLCLLKLCEQISDAPFERSHLSAQSSIFRL